MHFKFQIKYCTLGKACVGQWHHKFGNRKMKQSNKNLGTQAPVTIYSGDTTF